MGLADITATDSMLLKVRSSTPEYQGFKIAFGAPGIPSPAIFQRSGSYKTEFYLANTNDWQVVQVALGNSRVIHLITLAAVTQWTHVTPSNTIAVPTAL